MLKGLLSELVSHGVRGAVVPFSRVNNIKMDMLDLKNGEYHTDWLNRMSNHIIGDADKFIPSDIGFEPRSLISVVIPSPKVILKFHFCGELISCVVPPHYSNWDHNNIQVLHYLTDYLTPLGFSATIIRTFPQKMLAVHCGLGLYGRNNICYNSEFGSYMQIMTYISDLPGDETTWYPLRRMEQCETCHACVNACPTGAIDEGRQLINSDRCITYIDELPDEGFPEWIHKNAHNSIFGCSKCQDCCPANTHNKENIIVGATFTEEETAELLNHRRDAPYTASLAAKLEATGIPPEYCQTNVFPRNLAALLR